MKQHISGKLQHGKQKRTSSGGSSEARPSLSESFAVTQILTPNSPSGDNFVFNHLPTDHT
jgi:hypothetical protein